MVWYEVPVNSVMPIVIDMSTKITQVLQNVTLPTAVEDLEAIASRGLCKKTRFVIGQNIVGFVKVLFQKVLLGLYISQKVKVKVLF